MDRRQLALETIAKISGRPVETLTPELQLAGDLGVDSPKALELLLVLEERLELEISDDQAGEMATVGDILAFVETLSEIDVEGVEPTAHPAPVHDCFRDDVVVEGLERDDFLRNAPDSALDQIRVPKVVDS